MCRAVSEGGQRCAAHTRPAFQAAHARLADAALSGLPASDPRMDAIREQWDATALAYASTREGHTHFTAVLDSLDPDDHDTAARYATLVRRGTELREANTAAAEAIARQAALAQAPSVSPVLYAAMDRYAMPRGEADDYLGDLIALEHNATRFASDLTAQRAHRAEPGRLPFGGFDATDRRLLEAFEEAIDPHGPHSYTDDTFSRLVSDHMRATSRRQQQRARAYDDLEDVLGRVIDNQTRRALNHPAAGEQTFHVVTALSGSQGRCAALTHPRCPPALLNAVVRDWSREDSAAYQWRPQWTWRNDTIPEPVWMAARIKARDDLPLAVTLALHDPDPVERSTAVLEVAAQPVDALTDADARRLSERLDTMPVVANDNAPQTLAAHLTTFLHSPRYAADTHLAYAHEAILDNLLTSKVGREHLLTSGVLKPHPTKVNLRRRKAPQWADLTIAGQTQTIDLSMNVRQARHPLAPVFDDDGDA